MLKKLTRANVTSKVQRPVKVLQFGDGNFLRGFADWVIDIMNEKVDFNGNVKVIRPLRKGSSKKEDTQGGLYHVALMGLQNGKMISDTRMITCVSGFIDPYENKDDFLAAADNPYLKIVISNTTESGITFNSNDGNPDRMPESFPAKVALLLYHRFKTFDGDPAKGLIFLPCELIEKNGETLRSFVLQYSGLWKLPTEFARWVNECNTFCNTLVDRIVPGFPKDNIHEIQGSTGYEDNQVVVAEPFHFWAIEGSEEARTFFPVDKTELSVKFVKDLSPYRTRKVRILNGAHTALTPVAYLRGLRTVKESVGDSYCGSFLRMAIFEEIIPTLDSPEAELNQFANDVLERFQNPFIKHELSSIALNSISKYKVRVLPSVLEYVKRKGTLPERLIFSLACLIQSYKGDVKGTSTPVNDSEDIVEFFKKIWESRDLRSVVEGTLSNASFWDQDLTKVPGLTSRLIFFLERLADEDVAEVLKGKEQEI